MKGAHAVPTTTGSRGQMKCLGLKTLSFSPDLIGLFIFQDFGVNREKNADFHPKLVKIQISRFLVPQR